MARMLPAASPPETQARDYRATSAVAFAIGAVILSSNAPSPLYGVYQQRWGFSATALTAVYAVYMIGVIAAMFGVGPLSDQIGRRPVMIPALLVVAVGGVVFCLAQNLAWLIVGRILAGIGTGALAGAANAALIEVDPDGDRDRAAMIGTVALTIGAAIGPALTALMIHLKLWPTVLPFILVSLLALLAAAAVVWVPWPAPEKNLKSFRWRDYRLQRLSVPRAITRPFAIAACAVSIAWALGALFAALGPTLAVDLLQVKNRALAGLVLVGFQFCGGVMQVIARRYSPRRSLIVGPLAITAGLLLCLLAFSTTSGVLFILGTILTALGYGAAFVGSAALMNRIAPPDKRGEILSTFYLIGYAAMSLSVLAVGVTTDQIGLKMTMLLFTAVIGALSAVVLGASLRTPLSVTSPEYETSAESSL